MPATLNSFPPGMWVFFQTAGLLMVQGVRMPANQSGSTRSRKNPQYRKRSPTRTGITRFMLMRCPGPRRMTWHWIASMKSTNARMKPSYQSRKAA
jgi:hypothetical protein